MSLASRSSLRFIALATLALSIAASAASAESPMLLPYPEHFGEIPATTYDLEGERVGSSRLSVALTARDTVLMEVASGVKGGARTEARAELSPVLSRAHGKRLRLLQERSESYDESGKSLGLLQIDHDRGKATCFPPEGSNADKVLFDLPTEHRIANVPLNLLFQPLVSGESKQIDFQLFLCRGGPRIIDFAATIVGGKRPPEGERFRIVEVQYRPELGPMLSWLARGFTPNLSFWFDANAGGTYLAHRMPLFSRGPEVMIVRDGISPSLLVSIH